MVLNRTISEYLEMGLRSAPAPNVDAGEQDV
jgi:hypothetical protein